MILIFVADHNFIILDLFSRNDRSNYSPGDLNLYLSEINWSSFDHISDVNNKCAFLLNSIHNYLSTSVILKNVSFKPTLKWYNKQLTELKNEKTLLKIKWNENKNENDWKNYTRARNYYKNQLTTGQFPDYCKYSTIVPIQKVKSSYDANDLRPINTSCVFSHLIEKIVKDQIVDYFESNKLFASQQSEFRRNYSCETSIVSVLNDWNDSLDKNKIVIAVFLDLKRAFETINRTLLLRKLHLYGCDENVMKWFSSYLTNRF